MAFSTKTTKTTHSGVHLRVKLDCRTTEPDGTAELLKSLNDVIRSVDGERGGEEGEDGGSARKVQRTSKGMDGRNREENWKARLEACKQWKRTKRRFPKWSKKDKEETSLYDFLRHCQRGGWCYTPARWEVLNEAFGEGWEQECLPYLGTGGWVGPAGNQFRRKGTKPSGTRS